MDNSHNRRYNRKRCTKVIVIIAGIVVLVIVAVTIVVVTVHVYQKNHYRQAAAKPEGHTSARTTCTKNETDILIAPITSKCDSDSCFKCEEEVPAVPFYNDTEAACDIYNITSDGYLKINNDLFAYDAVNSETFRPPPLEKKFQSKCCILSQIGQKVNKCSPGSNFTCYNSDKEPICKCPTGSKGPRCEESSMNRMECKCFQCAYNFTFQDGVADCFRPEMSSNSKACRIQNSGTNCFCSIYSGEVLPKCSNFLKASQYSVLPSSAGTAEAARHTFISWFTAVSVIAGFYHT